jgi:hypothetical protein
MAAKKNNIVVKVVDALSFLMVYWLPDDRGKRLNEFNSKSGHLHYKSIQILIPIAQVRV